MTEKEKNLADKYLECRDKKEALVFADYNEKSTYVFDRPEVKAYIESKSPKIATSDEILEYCSKIMRGEEEEPVPIKEKDDEGNTVITVLSQPVPLATRIKVAELLGKRNGTFSESKKTENVLPVVIKDDLYE
ncbi:MAG: terminase small subunit [Lachnospirales bacterium]